MRYISLNMGLYYTIRGDGMTKFQRLFGDIFNVDLKTYDTTLKKEVILDLQNGDTIKISVKSYVDGEYFISDSLNADEIMKIKGIKNNKDVRAFLYSEKYRYIMWGKINFVKDGNAINYKIKELDFEDAFREERIEINQKALAYQSNKVNEPMDIFLKNMSYSGVFFETPYVLNKNVNIHLKDSDIEFEVEIVRRKMKDGKNEYGAIINKETINDIDKFESLLKKYLNE